MSSLDQKVDESQIKELYKERIRGYLPKTWEEYDINRFIDKLFKGLELVPGSEFGRVLVELQKKGIFRLMRVYDEEGIRIKTRKYFPNIAIVKTQIKRIIEEEYKNL